MFFCRIFLSYSLKHALIDMNANKIADAILSWDTDDEVSDEEEIYSGAVADKEEVSPGNIDIDSDSNKGESDDDLNLQPTSSVQASSECLWAEMALRGNAPIQ